MTLHDRIMRMDTRHLAGDESFWQGVDAARYRAIMIAKEADELIGKMAEALEQAVLSMQDSGYRNDSVAVRAGRQAVNKYKERKQ